MNSSEEDQVHNALVQIQRRIGVHSKFEKSYSLVLALIRDGHISAQQSNLLFEVLACAMLDKDTCQKMVYRKGYCKLVSAVVKVAHIFNEAQKKQIEVYQMWTLCRNEMMTDDSFVFGKNMNKLKELAQQLPISGPEDEEALIQWKARTVRLKEHYEEARRLDDFDFTNEKSLLWTDAECLAARREAIVAWLEAAKEPYDKHQWTCATVDLAIKVFNENRENFCQDQDTRITELVKFSKNRKMQRQQGPSTKEKRRDTTGFEDARKEWSKAQVSNRGVVGAEGDHRSEAWLG